VSCGCRCSTISVKRNITSSLAIAERPHCRVGIVMAKSGRQELQWETIGTLSRSIFNYCDVIGQQLKQSDSVKKMQNKGYYAVQGHSRSSRSV